MCVCVCVCVCVCNNSEYKHNKFFFQSLLPLLKREKFLRLVKNCIPGITLQFEQRGLAQESIVLDARKIQSSFKFLMTGI